MKVKVRRQMADDIRKAVTVRDLDVSKTTVNALRFVYASLASFSVCETKNVKAK